MSAILYALILFNSLLTKLKPKIARRTKIYKQTKMKTNANFLLIVYYLAFFRVLVYTQKKKTRNNGDDEDEDVDDGELD